MSKLMLFDFQCQQCAYAFEDLTKPTVRRKPCPSCGGNARRALSPVRIDHTAMAMSESASPGSVAHFDRLHRQQRAKEERSLETHGDVGKSPGSD